MPNAGGIKFADTLRHLFRRSQCTISRRRLPEIHRVADAQGLGRPIERRFVGAIKTREKQMSGTKWPGASASTSRGGCYRLKSGAIHVRRYYVGQEPITQP